MQSPFTCFVIANLITDLELYEHLVHSKNAVLKGIKDLIERIYLFNMWKKFMFHGMMQPEFIPRKKMTPWT